MRRLVVFIAVAVTPLAVSCATAGPRPVGEAGDPPAPPPTMSPAEPARPVPTALARRPEVFILGDSLTTGAAPWLRPALARRGWRVTGIDSRVGRDVDEGLDILAERAPDLPTTVLIALGTNDLQATSSEVAGWVARARRIVGSRRLLWVNVQVDDRLGTGLARHHRVNAALAAAAARHAVELVDWEEWATERGIETRSDGVHYDEDAYRQRAVFYADAIARPRALATR